MMTPQTMAVITRIFPAAAARPGDGLWGATAGVATLVGPILGGLLVDALGWEWIFFINVPVGADRLRARLAAGAAPRDAHAHVRLARRRAQRDRACSCWCSASRRATSTTGARSPGSITVRLIVAGLVVLAVFVFWQSRNRRSRWCR